VVKYRKRIVHEKHELHERKQADVLGRRIRVVGGLGRNATMGNDGLNLERRQEEDCPRKTRNTRKEIQE
jgi:hypothetical protein